MSKFPVRPSKQACICWHVLTRSF